MNPATPPSLQQAISMPGGGELLMILLIVLVVFGHNRLPAIGAGFGQAIRNFKKSMAAEDEPAQEKESSRDRRKDSEKDSEKAPRPEHAENKSGDKDGNKNL